MPETHPFHSGFKQRYQGHDRKVEGQSGLNSLDLQNTDSDGWHV